MEGNYIARVDDLAVEDTCFFIEPNSAFITFVCHCSAPALTPASVRNLRTDMMAPRVASFRDAAIENRPNAAKSNPNSRTASLTQFRS